MKKKRQAVNLVALCEPEKKDAILNKIFTLTTTFGVRVYLVAREKLSRKFIKIKTTYGRAKVKVGLLGEEIKNIAPEYEDYKKLAQKHHLPLKKIRAEILKHAFPKLQSLLE